MVASGPKSASKLTRDDVISLVGELDDGTLADILEADATHADVEQALMLLGVVEDLPIRPITAGAEAVRDILVTDPSFGSLAEDDK